VWRCDELAFTIRGTERFNATYPECSAPGSSGVTAVPVQWDQIERIGSALRFTFGGSLWLAAIIHILGVEVYVS